MPENIRKEVEIELNNLRDRLSKVTRATDALHEAGNIASEASRIINKHTDKASEILKKSGEKISESVDAQTAQLKEFKKTSSELKEIEKKLSESNFPKLFQQIETKILNIKQTIDNSGTVTNEKISGVLKEIGSLKNLIDREFNKVNSSIYELSNTTKKYYEDQKSDTEKLNLTIVKALEKQESSFKKSITFVEKQLQVAFNKVETEQVKIQKFLKINLAISTVLILVLLYIVFFG